MHTPHMVDGRPPDCVAIATSPVLQGFLATDLGASSPVVTTPFSCLADPLELARWADGVDRLGAAVLEVRVAQPMSAAFVEHSGLTGVAELARRVRGVARPLVAKRRGAIVCIVRRRPATAAAERGLCSALVGFLRSASCDLGVYGVSLVAVVVTEPEGGLAAPGMAALAQLVHIGISPAAREVSGEVYLLDGASLRRVLPPTEARQLVRSGARLGVSEVSEALARVLGGQVPDQAPVADVKTMTDRVAVVSGGGGGIGAVAARALAAAGAAVVVVDLGCDTDGGGRDPGPADAVARYICAEGGTALALCADVSDPEACADVVARTTDRFGRVDALCHAAGVVRQALVHEFADDDWDAVLGVHVRGAEHLARRCLEHMVPQGFGRIVLFSSRSMAGSPGHGVYATAKGAVLALAGELSRELTGTGVVVNTALPSGRTRASHPGTANARRKRIELLRARHHGITDPVAYRAAPEQDPENNAAMITWLCGPAAGAVSGRVFATGGLSVDSFHDITITAPVALPDVLALDQLRALP